LRGFGKITRDLTARRRTELALQTSEARFRYAFDEAQVGMVIVGLDGRRENVNDAFCAIVGYSREQLVGSLGEAITHPDDVAADVVELSVLVAGGAAHGAREKRYLHSSGKVVWALIHASLIRDIDGKPLHFIAQVQDITGRRLHQEQLEHMADHDPLTGLLNRRGFRRELDGHVARIARYGAAGALLMLDLDNFKHFNDSHGHSAGDELIVRIAAGLHSRVRASDVLARLGGDEFAILLSIADVEATHIAAESLLQIVRDQSAPAISVQKWVTASIGIARFDDAEGLTVEEIMVNADVAMYDAKGAGRDRYAAYHATKHSRRKIETWLNWTQKTSDAS
jgi:diguanylate cyclase (GGDEF)-like protein/PAS domain S-box-containing protein